VSIRCTAIAAAFLALTSCQTVREPGRQNPGAVTGDSSDRGVFWTACSPEYAALTEQAYTLARQSLDRGLREPGWEAGPRHPEGGSVGRPPAVILDVDETVLASTPYQAWLARSGHTYEAATFDRWASEAHAPAVPGAVEFCRYAASVHVEVFYITNRSAAMKEPTCRNLRDVGFPIDDACSHVVPSDGTGNKVARQEAIAGKYRVLLLIGDDINDFALGSSPATDAGSRWGAQWIVLPNPMYGSWEKRISGPSAPGADPRCVDREGWSP
jgi:5'-nucleotidase (lipoprotein e(P4) family)